MGADGIHVTKTHAACGRKTVQGGSQTGCYPECSVIGGAVTGIPDLADRCPSQSTTPVTDRGCRLEGQGGGRSGSENCRKTRGRFRTYSPGRWPPDCISRYVVQDGQPWTISPLSPKTRANCCVTCVPQFRHRAPAVDDSMGFQSCCLAFMGLGVYADAYRWSRRRRNQSRSVPTWRRDRSASPIRVRTSSYRGKQTRIKDVDCS